MEDKIKDLSFERLDVEKMASHYRAEAERLDDAIDVINIQISVIEGYLVHLAEKAVDTDTDEDEIDYDDDSEFISTEKHVALDE